MVDQGLIRLSGVTKRYTDQRIPLDGVDAEIPQGKTVVIMGPSGTGKSTLFRLLNRLEEPDEGEIYYQGKPLTQWDPIRLRREVHYVYQSPILFPETIADNLAYPLKIQGKTPSREQMEEVLQRVGFSSASLERSVQGLSGGEKQRVNLARSLMLDPPVLMLDEPTSSLDDASAKQVEKVIRRYGELGHTVLLISHHRDQAERLADEWWWLEGGKLRREVGEG